MPATLELNLHRFNVDEYYALNKAGIIHAGVELLDGVVFHKESAHRPPEPFRYTIEDVCRMYEAGILKDDRRYELIDGAIIEMTPIGSRHAAVVDRLNRLFMRRPGIHDRVHVRVQNPVQLSPTWLPQPDVALLWPRDDDYELAHPTAGDVYWLIEVAETTLEEDREQKAPRYARFRVPELWIVYLRDNAVEVYREPDTQREKYQSVSGHRGEEVISPLALPDERFPVAELLGESSNRSGGRG